MHLYDRFQQLRKSNIFKDSALVGAVQIVVIAIGFLSNALLARILDPGSLGSYQLLMSWLAVGAILGLPGFGVSILRSNLKGNSPFFWMALRYSMITSIGGATLVAATAWVLFESNLIAERTSLWIGLLAIGVLIMGLQHYDSVLIGKRDYKSSRLLALSSAITNLTLVGTVAYTTRSTEWVFIAHLISRLAVSIVGLILVKNRIIEVERNKTFDKELLLQGIRQTAVSIFTITSSKLDKIIIGIIDPTILAFYYVGTLIPTQLMANSKYILSVITTEWGGESSEFNNKKLKDHGRILLLFGIISCALMILILPLIIPFVFGEAYTKSIEIGQWFSLIIIGNFWFVMYSAHNQFQSNGISAQYLQILKQIIFIIVLFGTIEEYGVKGVLFSQILSYFTVYLVALSKFKNEVNS